MRSPRPKEVPGMGSEVIALSPNGPRSAQGPRGKRENMEGGGDVAKEALTLNELEDF